MHTGTRRESSRRPGLPAGAAALLLACASLAAACGGGHLPPWGDPSDGGVDGLESADRGGDPGDTGDACVPDCFRRECGDDGCGGSCGSCARGGCENLTWSSRGTCVPGVILFGGTYQTRLCSADVPARECDDGLGCTDDTCDMTAGCGNVLRPGWCVVDGTCVEAGHAVRNVPCLGCVPGISTTDGSPLPDGSSCPDGVCFHGSCCIPACSGLICGDDGCGGSCGACGTGTCAGLQWNSEGRCVQVAPGNRQCEPAPSVSCDDGTDCTEDACDPASGCVHSPVPGACVANGRCLDPKCCAGGSVLPEECNDLDDDCDGLTDDDLPVTQCIGGCEGDSIRCEKGVWTECPVSPVCLSFKCASPQGCHEGVGWVRVTDAAGAILYDGCPRGTSLGPQAGLQVTAGCSVAVQYSNSAGPCQGGHACDRARFDLSVWYGNLSANLGQANLDNGNDGGDRGPFTFVVTKAMLNAIGLP